MDGSISVAPGTVLDRKFQICAEAGKRADCRFFIAKHLLLGKTVIIELNLDPSAQPSAKVQAKHLSSGTVDGATYTVYEYDPSLSVAALQRQLGLEEIHPDLTSFVKAQRVPVKVRWPHVLVSCGVFALLVTVIFAGIDWYHSFTQESHLRELEKRVGNSGDRAARLQLANEYIAAKMPNKAAAICEPMIVETLRKRHDQGLCVQVEDIPLFATWIKTEPTKCPGQNNNELLNSFQWAADGCADNNHLDYALSFYDLAVRFGANTEESAQQHVRDLLTAYNIVSAKAGKPEATRSATEYYLSRRSKL